VSRKHLLGPGEPAPWFTARSPVNPRFVFDTAAGRYVVLCFFGSAADPVSRGVVDGLLGRAGFDGQSRAFFGVSIDPEDERQGRVRERAPGANLFWDFDREVSRQYGALVADPSGGEVFRSHTLVLDPRLRVLAAVPFGDDAAAHVARVDEVLGQLPPIGQPFAARPQAPVLVVPYVFEPELCRTLMRYYDDRGGEESGFMREVDGKTVAVHDHGHKRRRDQAIEDEPLRKACMVRLHDRLAPEIHKAYQFRATRVERYIVACYDAADGGHFRAHRDNTTKGTAHRRFAVSLHLNTGEFEGGALRFPEFGPALYTAPPGGAVVFSCSLLHEATPVTKGRRYMFLPFLYDDEAARIREQNLKFVGDGSARPAGETGDAADKKG
jgi:peroxiredoxin/predicted 2-oxoglutarate/Fe(II)-dependent dioxygenase YbiX